MGWYEEKLRKVKHYDAIDRSENEGHRISGDYASGRAVLPIYSNGGCDKRTAELADKYDEWRLDPIHRMTPTERVLVDDCKKHGIPVSKRYCRKEPIKPHTGLKSAVYFDDGFRKLFNTLEDASRCFSNDCRAVKLWDAVNGKYITKS